MNAREYGPQSLSELIAEQQAALKPCWRCKAVQRMQHDGRFFWVACQCGEETHRDSIVHPKTARHWWNKDWPSNGVPASIVRLLPPKHDPIPSDEEVHRQQRRCRPCHICGCLPTLKRHDRRFADARQIDLNVRDARIWGTFQPHPLTCTIERTYLFACPHDDKMLPVRMGWGRSPQEARKAWNREVRRRSRVSPDGRWQHAPESKAHRIAEDRKVRLKQANERIAKLEAAVQREKKATAEARKAASLHHTACRVHTGRVAMLLFGAQKADTVEEMRERVALVMRDCGIELVPDGVPAPKFAEEHR